MPVPAVVSAFAAAASGFGLDDFDVLLPSAARFSFFACFLAAFIASSPPSDFHLVNSRSYRFLSSSALALKEIFDSMKVELQQIPLAVKLLCLAVAPAVCEEFTFRGFLMSAFRRQTPTLIAIGVTAVLFGLFHVFVRDALMFERLLPSTLMGILLGWVCIRTGSVIPGMILHTIHNGLLICLAHFESELKSIGFGDAEQQHIPLLWLAVGVLPLLAGIGVMFMANVRSKTRLTATEATTTE